MKNTAAFEIEESYLPVHEIILNIVQFKNDLTKSNVFSFVP